MRLDDDDDEAERKVLNGVIVGAEQRIAATLVGQLTRLTEGSPAVVVGAMQSFDHGEELRLALFEELVLGVDAGAKVAAETLSRIGAGFDLTLVHEQAQQWARGYSYDLVRGINNTTRQLLQTAVGDWIGQSRPLSDLVAAVQPAFGANRAKVIAYTESTRAFSEGSILSFEQSGVVELFEWETVRDDRTCPICLPLHGRQFPLRGDMRPPAHIGCRCHVKPVVVEEYRRRLEKGPKKPKAPASAPVAQSPQAQFVRTQIQRTAQEFGVSEVEVERAIRNYLPTLTSGDVAVRLPSQHLDSVLRDGRLKTQFETGRSAGGGINTAARAEAEENGLGIARNSEPSQRPIYAYVRNRFSEEYVDAYGDATIVLKRDSIRSSTTYTVGDSLDAMRRNQVRGVALDQDGIEAWGGNTNRLYRMATGRITPEDSGLDYIETQIRGGVSISQIERVIDRGNMISATLRRRLSEAGISVVDETGD